VKISLNWLQDFIDLTETDNERIKAVITANTAEVETMEAQGTFLKNILLAKVEKLEPHPDADKLKLVTVNDGSQKIRVVCGGSNLREGMKIAFAHEGTVVQLGGDGGEMVKLQKVKIRGVESSGMICASTEIGLGEMFPITQPKEIVDLSHVDSPLGTRLDKALGTDDVVIDIDNHAITNRSDLFSHKGFAREFVANGLGKWKETKEKEALSSINTPPPIEVDIQEHHVCSRYCAVYITGVEMASSPEWMQKRLLAVGIRPINNIVDITNYVMMELGMPLHAFDYEQLVGKKYVMRLSKKGEKVVTLDQNEWILPEGVVVLADENEIYDLCGIMGGYQSGIKPETNKIWLHAPVFNGSLVRRASRALGHSIGASTIYEKGISNEIAMKAIIRATQLILELCPNAKVASKVTDICNSKPEARKITLKNSHITRLIGVEVSPRQVEKILTDLGFEVSHKKEEYEVVVPYFRLSDVTMEADVIEEIARIYGYDNIPMTTPITTITPPAINPRRALERSIKQQLVALGFDEIYTFAFLGPELLKKCDMKSNDTTIEILNPISSDMSLMRQSLLPRLMETIESNLRYHDGFRLFELSEVYHKTGDDPIQESHFIVATVGEDFRALQGVIEHLGKTLLPLMDSQKPLSHQHPGRVANIMLRGKQIGSLYQVHPQILKNFDIKTTVVVAEIDLAIVHAMNLARYPKYVELPKFPAVKLDVSIAIPRRDLSEKYFKAIQRTDKTLITAIELIDEYTGEKIDKKERALTYSITYQAMDRTLTEEEVNAIHHKVLEGLKTAGAAIR